VGAGKKINLLKTVLEHCLTGHQTIHKSTSYSSSTFFFSMQVECFYVKHKTPTNLLVLGRIFINQIVKNNSARSYIYVSDFMRTQVAECNAVVKQHLQRDGATFLHGKVSIITSIKSYGGEEKKRKRVSRCTLYPLR
jgi:hypothetical protein